MRAGVAAGTLLREYVYFSGKRVARRDAATGAVHYYLADQIGSADVVTTAAGAIEEESEYYPFGGERVYTDTLSDQSYKFTGKERDSETGLDYFGARYYGSNMGRWMSPDWSAAPVPVPYADLHNPQTLNLYGYVANNPLSHADVDGHCWPPGACARIVMNAVNRAQSYVEKKAVASGSPTLAAVATFTSGAARDAVNGAVGLATVGEASGAAMDSGNNTQRFVAAVEDGGKAGGLAVILAPVASALAAKAKPSVPQPNPNGQVIVGPDGTAVPIRAGQVAEPASNGNGIVYREPGTTGNANTTRIMGPDAQGRHPDGYVRIYNRQAQPVNPATNKPDIPEKTHTPL